MSGSPKKTQKKPLWARWKKNKVVPVAVEEASPEKGPMTIAFFVSPLKSTVFFSSKRSTLNSPVGEPKAEEDDLPPILPLPPEWLLHTPPKKRPPIQFLYGCRQVSPLKYDKTPQGKRQIFIGDEHIKYMPHWSRANPTEETWEFEKRRLREIITYKLPYYLLGLDSAKMGKTPEERSMLALLQNAFKRPDSVHLCVHQAYLIASIDSEEGYPWLKATSLYQNHSGTLDKTLKRLGAHIPDNIFVMTFSVTKAESKAPDFLFVARQANFGFHQISEVIEIQSLAPREPAFQLEVFGQKINFGPRA